ncbi:MAG: formylglycine-generating enzyme family protein [Leptolyngbya sp. LCM1.Bin17]|nr:MAG: formylglycine-generating enzyme family protein [Leptolyngbya sp. LCM1.Bin17]
MTFTTDQPQWREQAKQVDRFVQRFGNPAYRQLAYYGALPLVLTPELVHYLRIEFLRADDVPWEAEVDLLLSDLCSPVGYELYIMDTQVRAYLLGQIKDDPIWQQRMTEVAQVLISYVSYLSRTDPKRRQKELDAQRLAAMTYLGDDASRQAAAEIADRLNQLGTLAEAGSQSDKGIRSELAYLTRIAQEQAPQLRHSSALVEFAQLVQRLLRNPGAVSPEDVGRSFQVGEIELTPGVYPFRFGGPGVGRGGAGLPPLKTLTFETGQFVPEGASMPPLQTQTVEVVTLAFEDAAGEAPPAPSTTEPLLMPFSFEVATIAREPSAQNQWVITRQLGEAELYEERLGDNLALEMVAISGGSFVMGSPPDEPERFDREGPQHEVTVDDFFMGRYPVTQAQWQFVAGLPEVQRGLEPDPSRFKGGDRPVERISWFDAVEFFARLSAYTGQTYRLPSEAEWEYACRAGTTTPFHFGETISPELANYGSSTAYNDGPTGEYLGETTPVEHFAVANAFGLSDMHGNVYEWCQDHWHSSYEGAPKDGSAWVDEGAEGNKSRVIRGGAWSTFPRYCRSAYRVYDSPRGSYDYIGFRVVCVAPRALG